ncbi:molybdopterin-dependent oxidoreductase [Sphingomonas jatrophae]|uniref:DMSO/TMAO reductase YedYZ, molybdopterin-dependent catalytic subunit n=1 Tax=Sphingomonas jatrophae TaxID=1166337 RepID=A0A1I6LM19_9SPHN|nr:molybdopterin-dependent oxidoreductase [Sphingomonas jatrophae]SFS04607.1 DMSO/TMAO reductase YedYZ, molybdopterin-dependent catalytic subunit [Sphingomonas jatrophae]
MTIGRRPLLAGLAALPLTACDRLDGSPAFRSLLRTGERLTHDTQRLLVDRSALAREFGAGDLSTVFRANGNVTAAGPAYAAHVASGFRDWRVRIDGLVTRPLSVSLDEMRRLPRRTQITRHDCVEGWSAIGQWTGVPLRILLDMVGVQSAARYIVFHCADRFGATPYYESVDMIDARHPQTILAYALNGAALPVANGAPLRVRIERQLGYKSAKYIERIEAVADLGQIGRGKGGYWEDVADYAWYAGI